MKLFMLFDTSTICATFHLQDWTSCACRCALELFYTSMHCGHQRPFQKRLLLSSWRNWVGVKSKPFSAWWKVEMKWISLQNGKVPFVVDRAEVLMCFVNHITAFGTNKETWWRWTLKVRLFSCPFELVYSILAHESVALAGFDARYTLFQEVPIITVHRHKPQTAKCV